MADRREPAPEPPPADRDVPPAPSPATAPVPPASPGDDAPPGRYDANLALIRRRLADHARDAPKPRWWWRVK